jgi:hypothetical protein
VALDNRTEGLVDRGPEVFTSLHGRFCMAWMVFGEVKQCRGRLSRHSAGPLRPGREISIVSHMVEPLRAQRVVDRVGEVQSQVTGDNRQLADTGRAK